MQTTLKSAISFSGYGLHTGCRTSLTIRPASAEHGIWFVRTDIDVGDRMIPARWDAVVPSSRCTKLQNSSGVKVATVEHVLAALSGCGVHNALVEIDGPEVPILDGSALPFVRGIMQRGLRQLNSPVRAFEVLREVAVSDGTTSASLAPSDVLHIDFEIDFADEAIGRQKKSLRLSNGTFVRELCDSRTFCSQSDVHMMKANGLALGGTPGENAIVFSGSEVMSPGGLRHHDEPVRHKMLDAVGDLALAGAPLLGRYSGVRAGHSITNALLGKLFSTPDAVRMIVCDENTASRLPGHGLFRQDVPAVA